MNKQSYIITSEAVKISARDLVDYFINTACIDLSASFEGMRRVVTPDMIELVKRLKLALDAADTEAHKC